MHSTDEARTAGNRHGPAVPSPVAPLATLPVVNPQLHGRSAEVGKALRVLRAVLRTQEGGIITVSGESGAGKTAVCAEVAELADRLGFMVRGAAAEPGHQGVPLGPLLLALRSGDAPLL
jgi:Mrp family chromosome partitioning ATPase